MKKFLGYALIVVLGVGVAIALMYRSETVDNNLAKGTNAIYLC